MRHQSLPDDVASGERDASFGRSKIVSKSPRDIEHVKGAFCWQSVRCKKLICEIDYIYIYIVYISVSALRGTPPCSSLDLSGL